MFGDVWKMDGGEGRAVKSEGHVLACSIRRAIVWSGWKVFTTTDIRSYVQATVDIEMAPLNPWLGEFVGAMEALAQSACNI